jgi:hypothetical protein
MNWTRRSNMALKDRYVVEHQGCHRFVKLEVEHELGKGDGLSLSYEWIYRTSNAAP